MSVPHQHHDHRLESFGRGKESGRSLEGDCILITGAGGGIGQEIAVCFALAGATHIILWDLSAERMKETAQRVLREASQRRCSCGEALRSAPKVWSYEVDLSDNENVYSTADLVQKDLAAAAEKAEYPMCDYVSVLVNNAGIGSGGESLLLTSDDRIKKSFEVNALAHFWTCKAFLPTMQVRGSGHVVTVASMQGHIALPKMTEYSASKHAAVGFTEALRRELRAEGFSGIGTSCICPCHVETDMFKGYKQPLIPSLTPREVGQAVVEAVAQGQEVVILPRVSSVFAMLNKVLPSGMIDLVGQVLGIDAGATNLDQGQVTKTLALMEGARALNLNGEEPRRSRL
eukprot:TRINITY_DN30831_c0_g1_i1.p1 TRINITY_DN30831_c0_g1~~TRINITY_DN30831_c0_g1_i1.p1  ORF type:complete len:344 (-),score=100.88 TRINITY_DN30831_c0_g1_i1:572-1603(-)